MRFASTVNVRSALELQNVLPSLQRGQWINMDGVRGRVVGQSAATTWIAWSKTATDAKRFTLMCNAFKA